MHSRVQSRETISITLVLLYVWLALFDSGREMDFIVMVGA
jgi:hypothetical protein